MKIRLAGQGRNHGWKYLCADVKVNDAIFGPSDWQKRSLFDDISVEVKTGHLRLNGSYRLELSLRTDDVLAIAIRKFRASDWEALGKMTQQQREKLLGRSRPRVYEEFLATQTSQSVAPSLTMDQAATVRTIFGGVSFADAVQLLAQAFPPPAEDEHARPPTRLPK